jgi:hypothetical protein
MMGQEFNVTTWSTAGITIAGETTGANGELILIAKIDTNLSKIDSPMMKDTARVLKEINGKRVRLTVTPMGKTLKTEAVDAVEQNPASQMMGGGNPADYMRSLFVKLPEQEVGIGDSWKQTAPDTMMAQGFNMIMKPDITFKIESAEKFGGYDCLKITYEGPSSQYGTGSRNGMAHFAPKEGLLVGVEQSTTTDTNISGTGEQMITITQSSSATSKVTLAK